MMVDRGLVDYDDRVAQHWPELAQNGGRLHGYSFLHEACVQLWQEGGGCLLLSRA
jgi:CubicO group peptidase (beta-lactamase class C family)